MGESDQDLLMVEPPRGMYPSRLDDKGRLKLPVTFQHFFGALREKKLFVTSLDRRIAQIYPMPVWRANEKFFASYRENPRAVQNVIFNANDLGSEAEMDSQGRVLLSPELRRELGLENAPVRIYANGRRIEILSEEIYAERRRQAAETAQDDVNALAAAGLI